MSTLSAISGVASNSNGWAAARSQMQARMFAKADADGSGGVDKTELQSMLDDISKKTGVSSTASTGTSGTSTDELFTKMDSNGDGSLSSDELAKGMQSLMPAPSTMDFAQAHGPGGQGGPSGPGGPPPSSDATSYDPLDTNQDGTVSEAEKAAGQAKTDALQALFKSIDTNGDNKISSTESDAFISELTSALQAASSASTGTSTGATNTSTSSSSATTTASNASASTAETTATAAKFDVAQLAKLVYEQIAQNWSSQANSATLSAVA